jgi:hypothetical protein
LDDIIPSLSIQIPNILNQYFFNIHKNQYRVTKQQRTTQLLSRQRSLSFIWDRPSKQCSKGSYMILRKRPRDEAPIFCQRFLLKHLPIMHHSQTALKVDSNHLHSCYWSSFPFFLQFAAVARLQVQQKLLSMPLLHDQPGHQATHRLGDCSMKATT